MSSGRRRILVIDDEPQLRRLLRVALEAEGDQVLEAATAREGIAAVAHDRPDAVLLDLGLPDVDGHAVLRRIREFSAVPVVVLSVRAAEDQKVAALDAGADDYVTKPFGIPELLARLRAALRHRWQGEAGEPVIRQGDLVIDLPRRVVTLDGVEVKMSPKEYELLRLLATSRGKVLTHRMLLEAVWGPAHVADTQYLRVYVGQLRDKLRDDPAEPRFIATEPGVGYRFLGG
ncbi:MAG: response regulator [Alphaproteobacteria bacterium]|nr:response regulator [Alphaproteobacteria bacterium]